jgi:signal transduction histidine kinase
VRVVVGCAVVVLGGWAEYQAYDRDDAVLWLPDLLTGLSWLALGMLVWSRSRPTAALSVAFAATWFAGTAVPMASTWHRAVLVHLLLSCPGWLPRTSLGRASLGVLYAAVCIPGIWRFEVVNMIAAVAVAAVVAAERMTAWVPARRLSLTIVVIAGLVATVLVIGAVARGAVPGTDAVVPALLAYEVALIVAAVLLWRALAGYRIQRVTDAVVELGADPGAGLRAALALALEERDLQVAGQAAARLASTHQSLQREVSGSIAEVEASRRRLVVAADEERARLEDRLREGALSRIEHVATLVDELDPGLSPTHLAAARSYLDQAQEELLELAHGLHPRHLADGLAPALRSLTGASRIPVDLSVDTARFSPDREAAAYFTCAEAFANALKHAHASRIELSVHVEGSALVVRVRDDGVGGADVRGAGLVGLADRVAATGGTLQVVSAAGTGTEVIARIGLL